MEHTIYIDDSNDPDDGKILGMLMCAANLVDMQNPGEGKGLFYGNDLEPALDSDVWWFNNSSMELRPAMPTSIDTTTVIANGIDDFLITGLPAGVQITATGPSLDYEGIETDGDFGFATVVAGVYTIKAELFPYLDQQWEVTFE